MTNEIIVEAADVIMENNLQEVIGEQPAKEGELVGTTNEEAGKILLKTQGNSIKRLMDQKGLKASAAAKQLGVSRQLIYLWQWGKQLITEDKLEELADLLDREPVEIRYDITLFKQKDLYFVVREVEKELLSRGLTLDPDKKAYVVSSIFAEFQNLKKLFGENNAMTSFKNSLYNSLDSLSIA